jgi:hypothetical protein
MRKKINNYDNISPDGRVVFKEEGHEYIKLADPDFKFTSVTTVLHEYGEKFDAIAVSKKCAKSPNSEYYGMKPEDIREQWENASKEGTALHDYGERVLNHINDLMGDEEPTPYDHPKAKYIPAIVNKLKLEGYKLARTELLVYNDDVNISTAGQADIILKKDFEDTTHYMIYDWKFLKKPIQKKSYFNPFTRKYKKMSSIFKYLDDCNFIHYSIQLSIYQTLTGQPELITEKVLVVVNEDKWEFVPCLPMRVFWDENDTLQCIHETWDGRWYDSRIDKIRKYKPTDIKGL